MVNSKNDEKTGSAPGGCEVDWLVWFPLIYSMLEKEKGGGFCCNHCLRNDTKKNTT